MIMNRLLLSLLLVCFSFYSFAQKGHFVTRITFPKSLEIGEDYEDKKNKVEFVFLASYGDITFYMYNNNRERVYIEWENAKMNHSRIVFGDDSRLTMSRTKADEAVMGFSSSETRDIYPQSYVSSDFVIPIYDTEKVSGGEKASFSVVIPIRFEDGRVIDYNIHIDVLYMNMADYSGLRIGMKKKEVKEIMDIPNKIISRDKQQIWVYTNNVQLILVNNKLTEIVPDSPKI